jgi:hypothetical protein
MITKVIAVELLIFMVLHVTVTAHAPRFAVEHMRYLRIIVHPVADARVIHQITSSSPPRCVILPVSLPVTSFIYKRSNGKYEDDSCIRARGASWT